MRSFFTDNINSILGAISLHLLIVLAFFWFKLGEMDEIQKEQILIEFNEEIQPLPEENQSEERSPSENAGEALASLDRQTLSNIASNVAGKLDPQISTSAYEKQVLQELGIESLESPGAQLEQSAEQSADENAIQREKAAETNTERNLNVPNIIRKDNTTVSYFLEGRWHNYIYIPTYKCQGGGTVQMDIVIDQQGRVVSALIQENKSTNDPCLREEAYRSAVSARFNVDQKASTKQLGTIAYVFMAQ